MTNENKLPSIESLEVIELPVFDPTPFIGVKALVDHAELKQKLQTSGKIGYYVEFKALVDPTGFGGEPLYATRLVGVQVDQAGNMGWGSTTKMAEFLKYHKVDHPKDIVGKIVIIQTQKDSTYLTF